MPTAGNFWLFVVFLGPAISKICVPGREFISLGRELFFLETLLIIIFYLRQSITVPLTFIRIHFDNIGSQKPSSVLRPS